MYVIQTEYFKKNVRFKTNVLFNLDHFFRRQEYLKVRCLWHSIKQGTLKHGITEHGRTPERKNSETAKQRNTGRKSGIPRNSGDTGGTTPRNTTVTEQLHKKNKLPEKTNYTKWENQFLRVLNKHAPLQLKVIRGNNKPFVPKL